MTENITTMESTAITTAMKNMGIITAMKSTVNTTTMGNTGVTIVTGSMTTTMAMESTEITTDMENMASTTGSIPAGMDTEVTGRARKQQRGIMETLLLIMESRKGVKRPVPMAGEASPVWMWNDVTGVVNA